eukprot:352975_1
MDELYSRLVYGYVGHKINMPAEIIDLLILFGNYQIHGSININGYISSSWQTRPEYTDQYGNRFEVIMSMSQLDHVLTFSFGIRCKTGMYEHCSIYYELYCYNTSTEFRGRFNFRSWEYKSSDRYVLKYMPSELFPITIADRRSRDKPLRFRFFVHTLRVRRKPCRAYRSPWIYCIEPLQPTYEYVWDMSDAQLDLLRTCFAERHFIYSPRFCSHFTLFCLRKDGHIAFRLLYLGCASNEPSDLVTGIECKCSLLGNTWYKQINKPKQMTDMKPIRLLPNDYDKCWLMRPQRLNAIRSLQFHIKIALNVTT